MTDRDYLKLAYAEARKSGDLSTQNGAVLVRGGEIIATGHNDIYPHCADTPERRQRPVKYYWVEHAERAAIYQAARMGKAASGSILYCPWLACADCGRAILFAGVWRVVRHKIPQHAQRPDWAASIAIADQMFREAGIEVVELEGALGESFRFDGQIVSV